MESKSIFDRDVISIYCDYGIKRQYLVWVSGLNDKIYVENMHLIVRMAKNILLLSGILHSILVSNRKKGTILYIVWRRGYLYGKNK